MRIFKGKELFDYRFIDGHLFEDVGGRLVHVQQGHLEGSLLAEQHPTEHIESHARHDRLDQHGVQSQVGLAVHVEERFVVLSEELGEQLFELLGIEFVQRHRVANLLRGLFVLGWVILKAHPWTDARIRDALARDTGFDLDVDLVTQMVHVQSP
ncbi:hypothetical protein D3C87_1193780 [compost metagenome]